MGTLTELKVIPSFDEIVFASRNKEYGAYVLRKAYCRNVAFGIISGVILAILLVVLPYLIMKAHEDTGTKTDRVANTVILTAQSLPQEKVIVPEPLPRNNLVQPVKYVPPVVVDSVKPEESFELMTQTDAGDRDPVEDIIEIPAELQPEIQDETEVTEPYTVVQEPPMYPGGIPALLEYVFANLQYPQVAIENNIQGRVTVKFCVTPSGGVSMISIMKGVDDELDKEVMRVVSTLPAFRPGKQNGKPVPVWFILPVNFKLKAA